MDHLPHDIISDILGRLSPEQAMSCKEVCKTWRNLLDHIKRDQKINLLFAVGKHHSIEMELYYAEYDEKNYKTLQEQLSYNALTLLGYPYIHYREKDRAYRPMVGSHRGLICFLETRDNINDPINICNPFTRETILLPRLPLDGDAGNDFLVSGFGYLYATNKYKVVRIHYSPGRFKGGKVQVYTLGDKNEWRYNIDRTYRKLGDRIVCPTTQSYSKETSNGILSNGALHWIGDMGVEIVAFSLADEKFRSLPLPDLFPLKYSDDNAQLLLLGGYLSIVIWYKHDRNKCRTDIWSLKPDTENRSGCRHWSKQLTLTHLHPQRYHPFAFTEEGRVLLWGGFKEDTLCHYDPQTATLEEFKDDDAERFYEFQTIPYMKNDVSLTVLEPDLPLIDSYYIGHYIDYSDSDYDDNGW